MSPGRQSKWGSLFGSRKSSSSASPNYEIINTVTKGVYGHLHLVKLQQAVQFLESVVDMNFMAMTTTAVLFTLIAAFLSVVETLQTKIIANHALLKCLLYGLWISNMKKPQVQNGSLLMKNYRPSIVMPVITLKYL